jgi:hypothetical protein
MSGSIRQMRQADTTPWWQTTEVSLGGAFALNPCGKDNPCARMYLADMDRDR